MELQELYEVSKKLRVLYVEDNKDAQEAMLFVFNDLFKDVVTAQHGQEGFERFKEAKFDLIVTDINMPVLDGLEMAKKIREITKDIPIVILSAYNSEEFLLKSIDIGIDGYLFKPLNMENLKRVLGRIARNIQIKYEKKSLEQQLVDEKENNYKRRLRIQKMAARKQEELLFELKKTKTQIEEIHKHTRDSIEYAALIQEALIPEANSIEPFFKDSFVTWLPKDTVGGDIWLFNELRHKDECLLFFIDCTGHGVPGAFVTMIVKSIEREIVSKLKKRPDLDISPAIIMSYFNTTMKKLLRQEDETSVSNAGFDGGIIYYNRRTQILKFAGAETPLFYIDVKGELHTIKGNRYSVGYKKCAIDYKYKETILNVEEGMKFYCTTDGYLDQNGGEKGFPFGKKRFGEIIKNNYQLPMSQQQEIFQKTIEEYAAVLDDNERNDDMTVIGFEIAKRSDEQEIQRVEIIKYDGVMTQNVIAAIMDNLEAKIKNLSTLATISTITIEYCQNMMNYSKEKQAYSKTIDPAGVIEVTLINESYYIVRAKNIVSFEDKQKIKTKLQEIKKLDKKALKQRYRELRRSGKNTHEKGGGIGLYEIAKVSDEIDYYFTAINEDKYYFSMSSIVYSK